MIAEIVDKNWDVVIIGAGMGGGIAGRILAEKGLSVLFIERGPNGPRAEQNSNAGDMDPLPLLVRGVWPEPIEANINGRQSRFHAGLGAGVGGTSVFYAATLERPEAHDFDTSQERPHPTGGWPVSYNEWLPYLDEAERMLHVSGGQDPNAKAASSLRDPPELGAGDRQLMDAMREDGLNPYRLHAALKFVPGCMSCLGRKCPRDCKMDGRSAGVEPAVHTGNAAVLDMCAALAFRGSKTAITHVECKRGDETFSVRGKRFILAAGAMNSPRLLLASRSNDWPGGCANSSDQVGRNLMFHLTELVAIWPPKGAAFDGPSKSIGLRDFYYADGQRYGMLQSLGVDASYGMIAQALKGKFDRSVLRNISALRPLVRVPAKIASRVLGDAKVFAGILEDLPYGHNRVLLDEANSDRIRFEYSYSKELLERRSGFRRLVGKKLKSLRHMFLNYETDLNFPHCSGTLRFGDDASSSVFDRNCRAHDVENLYVADASFMPTSSGTNPSLMIAANAIRTSTALIQDFQR